MTSFVLKIIALICMTLDHFSILVLNQTSGVLRIIGRIAFPLFAFQLTEGYIHTHNKYKYFMLLLLFGFISQLPFTLAFGPYLSKHGLNIFFTLLLGFMALYTYDSFKLWLDTRNIASLKKYSSLLSIFVMIPYILLGKFLNVDYGFWGVLIICTFYLLRNYRKNWIFVVAYFILCILKYYKIFFYNTSLISNLPYFIATFLSIIFIYLYNGKQGPKTKYLFYIYYPLHLLILYMI